MENVKNKVVVEILSTYEPSQLGTVQLLIAAANNDGAKITQIKNVSVEINPHVVLLAKGHYVRGETVTEDIKIMKEIFAEYTATPLEYMHLYQCFMWISETAGKLLSTINISRAMQEMRVENITPLNLRVKDSKNNDACVSVYTLMNTLLSEISLLPVSDIPNWDKIKQLKYEKWAVK